MTTVERYVEFYTCLMPKAQAFLAALYRSRDSGPLTRAAAMAALGTSIARTVGRHVGSIARWAPVRGIPVPFEETKADGALAWAWTGDADWCAAMEHVRAERVPL